MKKFLCVLLALLTLTALVACGGNGGDGGNTATAEQKVVDMDALLADITTKYEMVDGFIYTSSSTEVGEYLDDDMIISCYGDAGDAPDFSKVDSYCVYMDDSDPTVIIDCGIFKMADTSYSDTFMNYLQARIDFKIKDGEVYTDIDIDMLKTAVVAKKGNYVYYVVSYDVNNIVTDIKNAIG